jgi:SAM-dependent methyltransferase
MASTPHAHGTGSGELPIMDETFWDERYGQADAIWSGNPNPQLVDETADLPAGTALDVGCGEGADAIWLAGRGWHVTAVDISQVALDRAVKHAEAAGVADRISWLRADLTDGTSPGAGFDLVSAHFLHLPTDQRVPLYRRLAATVAPGGTFLVVGHHPSDMATAMGRPNLPDLYFTAAQVAEELDAGDWTILVNEKRARTAADPDGHDLTIQDAILKARRTIPPVPAN